MKWTMASIAASIVLIAAGSLHAGYGPYGGIYDRSGNSGCCGANCTYGYSLWEGFCSGGDCAGCAGGGCADGGCAGVGGGCGSGCCQPGGFGGWWYGGSPGCGLARFRGQSCGTGNGCGCGAFGGWQDCGSECACDSGPCDDNCGCQYSGCAGGFSGLGGFGGCGRGFSGLGGCGGCGGCGRGFSGFGGGGGCSGCSGCGGGFGCQLREMAARFRSRMACRSWIGGGVLDSYGLTDGFCNSGFNYNYIDQWNGGPQPATVMEAPDGHISGRTDPDGSRRHGRVDVRQFATG